jgi:hypothetical protein
MYPYSYMLLHKKCGKRFIDDRLSFLILILITGTCGKLLQNCGVLWNTMEITGLTSVITVVVPK